jgi:hypothetical protein
MYTRTHTSKVDIGKDPATMPIAPKKAKILAAMLIFNKSDSQAQNTLTSIDV